jgi:hypothetical protein
LCLTISWIVISAALTGSLVSCARSSRQEIADLLDRD